MDFIFSFDIFKKVIFGMRTKKQFNELIKNLSNIKKLKKDQINKIIKINMTNFYFKNSKTKYNN